jgi:PAS domain S-box-containing protein
MTYASSIAGRSYGSNSLQFTSLRDLVPNTIVMDTIDSIGVNRESRALEMNIEISPLLVIASILVAIFASYVALSLVNNFAESKGRVRAVWLASGAFAMGIGIWSMHFIGMLAYEMPGMSMGYDPPLMLLSIVVAIAASGLAFYIVSHRAVPILSLISGGTAMAAAISGMHYIGMYSMRMNAVIKWNVSLVILSVFVALVASYGALLILIRFRDNSERFDKTLIASTIMGLAVAGMHYTGMLAATFIHKNTGDAGSDKLVVTDWLVPIVIAATIFLLAMALSSSLAHRILTRRSRKASELLGKSEEKFRRLVEAVKDYAIFMLDAEGHITTWNRGAERITGYLEHEVLGKHSSIFYQDQDVDAKLPRKDLTAAADIHHFESDGLRKRKDGSLFWASVTIVPLHDIAGNTVGFSTVIRDITQFKESERQMRQLNEELEERVQIRTLSIEQREKQLATIANAVPVLIAQYDREENLLFANEAYRKFLLSVEGSIIGKSLCQLVGDIPYLIHRPYIQKVLNGELTNYERETPGTDGLTLAVTLMPEFSIQGMVSGFILVASDITQYKEIQLELQRAKEAAEVANATKTAFLANMSHEIRTPLGAVIGFSDLLSSDNLPNAERLNYMEVIKRNGRLLSNIINDILDLSKVEIGKLEIDMSDVAFSEILNELRSILGLEASAKGIELILAPDENIPQRFRTDPLRLRQILFNIVGNAIKFTKTGSVRIAIKVTQGTDKSSMLAFIVTDTGEGISPEQKDRLFSPFMQADVSTTRKFGGTGLGLALSKKLANLLQGDVILSSSTPGKGSTFTITIALVSGEAPAPDKLEALSTPEVKADTQFNLKGLKILVVDDSLDNQALIKRILKLAGADIVTANNGKEAVDMAKNEEFDIILMDIQMPVMDGYQATRALRSSGFTKPIIALTAHAMNEERKRSLESGFDDHITKPIDRKLLLKVLAHHNK